jgi:hypothetical protein
MTPKEAALLVDRRLCGDLKRVRALSNEQLSRVKIGTRVWFRWPNEYRIVEFGEECKILVSRRSGIAPHATPRLCDEMLGNYKRRTSKRFLKNMVFFNILSLDEWDRIDFIKDDLKW